MNPEMDAIGKERLNLRLHSCSVTPTRGLAHGGGDAGGTVPALRHPGHADDGESAVIHDGRSLHGIATGCEEGTVFEHGQTVSPFPAKEERLAACRHKAR